MAINRIKTRIDFGKYCLRKLGDPVVMVNVSPEQIDDAIDDALDMFWEYHADGSVQMFFKHEITQADLDAGVIEIPENTLAVIRVLSLGGGSGSSGIANFDNLQYYAYFSDLISKIPGGGMSSYVMNLQYLNTISEVFNAEKLFEFNKHQGKLVIQGDTSKLRVGEHIIYEAVVTNDPEEHPLTWDNWWLKNYATALIKKQWGVNLGKYANVTLPSGVTMNGETIRAEGIAEIADLEDRLRNEFSLPPDFFYG